LQFDLRKFPGWEDADEPTKKRMVEAAKRYIHEGQPQNDRWVGTNIIFPPALSGYRALFLLLAESPQFVEELSLDIWAKWAATIVSYPLNSYGGDEMLPHNRLVEKAYTAAPEKVIEAIMMQIASANDKEEPYYFPQRLEVCWDAKFKNALRDKLSDEKLKTNSWSRILEELLEHGDTATQEIAQAVLTSFLADKTGKDRALAAATSLMEHGEGNQWWPLVWQAIKDDSDFGRAMVESISDRTHPASKLKEHEVAQFYLWLVKVFPPAEDPELPTGYAFAVTPRMEITKFRNSFLNDLKQRGTPESLTALEKIASASPELEKQLKWILIEARDNVRRHSWKPPTPLTFLTLLKSIGPNQFPANSAPFRHSQTTVEKLWKLIESNFFWGGGVGLAVAAYSFEWASVPQWVTVLMLTVAWLIICTSIYKHQFFEKHSVLLQIVINLIIFVSIAATFVVVWLVMIPNTRSSPPAFLESPAKSVTPTPAPSGIVITASTPVPIPSKSPETAPTNFPPETNELEETVKVKKGKTGWAFGRELSIAVNDVYSTSVSATLGSNVNSDTRILSEGVGFSTVYSGRRKYRIRVTGIDYMGNSAEFIVTVTK
jgi:hypothetical protein